MSALIGSGGFLSLAKQASAYPVTFLAMFNQSNTGTECYPVAQSTAGTDRLMRIILEGNGTTNDANHRNIGGAPSANASLNVSRSGNTWYALRVRFNSASSRDITVGPVTNFAADTNTVTDDLSLHDLVKLGDSLVGMLAEVGIFSGTAVSDANYTSYRAGTLLVENMTGVTLAASLLTVPTSATTLTAETGQTMTVNGTVTQGSSHPIARTAPDTTAPTLSSAAVANGTPTVVNLVMSEAMDTGNVPAASAFTVSGHTVSSVAITGSTINLTVSAAFVNGEAVRTVAYTQPGTNNARDVAGNLLANFTGQAITNNVAAADTTAPTFSSAQVANAAPANIVIAMSETLAAFTPAASAFAVSGGKTVSSVARSGATVTLTCSAAYAFGDTITVTYTKPGTNMLQDAAGNQTASFGPSAVTNNISSGSTVTISSPSAGGKRVADGTYRASVACNVTALDKSTHAVLERKTGLTSPASGPLIFTSTVLTAGTERLFLVKADADDKDIGAFFATPV